jgi:hypothetical protein
MSCEHTRVAPKQRQLVTKVAETYRRMKHLPVLNAQNLDEAPSSHSPKWSEMSCFFVTDCEALLRDITAGRPDRSELIRAWVRISIDGFVIGPSEATLIELVAPVIRSRGLQPWVYFRPHRRGRRAV